MNNTELLLKLKKDIEDSKLKKAQLEGKLQIFEEQLKNDFNCDVNKATELLSVLENEMSELEEQLTNKINKIKESV